MLLIQQVSFKPPQKEEKLKKGKRKVEGVTYTVTVETLCINKRLGFKRNTPRIVLVVSHL